MIDFSTLEMVFQNPKNLFFLLSLPILVVLHYTLLRYVKGRVLQFANFVAIARVASPITQPSNIIQLMVRLLTLTFIVLAVSGLEISYLAPGLESDYVLAVDVSSSMLSTDITPTRFDAAKEAAAEFVRIVPAKTQMGIVSFAGTAFVEQRLTDDKSLVEDAVNELAISAVGGTDVGEAIVSSINLMLSTERPKTVILLTDGRSNIGVGASRAIDYANENSVQVYTIGIATLEGGAPEGINVTLTLDEGLLRSVAEQTGAAYLPARNKDEITDSYKSILTSSTRKLRINLTTTLMFLALLASFIDWVLLNTKYKRIP